MLNEELADLAIFADVAEPAAYTGRRSSLGVASSLSRRFAGWKSA